MDSAIAVLLFLGIFLGLALLRVPVGFSLGIAGLFVMYKYGIPVGNAPAVAFQSLDTFPFLAIPGFIYAGDLMTNGGISKAIVNFTQAILGKIKGSLGLISVVASMMFGTVTGSSLATVAAIGSMMIPEMVEAGYKRNYATALISASGFLGILIPPSIPGIIYAITSGVPVPIVWVSTIGPGILIGIGYIIVNYFVMGDKQKFKSESVSKGHFADLIENGRKAFPALLLPLLIFGGIYGGVVTPTEAAAVSVAYGLIIALLVYHGIDRKNFWSVTKSSAISSATVSILIAFAAIAGRMITLMNVADNLSGLIKIYIHSPFTFLVAVNILYLILGMLMETNTAILVTGPILIPLAISYGINPVHFGAIMLVNLCIGFITPPFAANLFVGCRIGNVQMQETIRPLLPFLAVGIIVLILTTYVPTISMFLPNLFYSK
ncbi:TRAP transporter large permease [Thermoanaerobacteraceae bacterium SP2]|nr:TRAP transporter large permease [Thermoanaerobacteraceae bacterium SP2]